jgi:hypothetical protein
LRSSRSRHHIPNPEAVERRDPSGVGAGDRSPKEREHGGMARGLCLEHRQLRSSKCPQSFLGRVGYFTAPSCAPKGLFA